MDRMTLKLKDGWVVRDDLLGIHKFRPFHWWSFGDWALRITDNIGTWWTFRKRRAWLRRHPEVVHYDA